MSSFEPWIFAESSAIHGSVWSSKVRSEPIALSVVATRSLPTSIRSSERRQQRAAAESALGGLGEQRAAAVRARRGFAASDAYRLRFMCGEGREEGEHRSKASGWMIAGQK